METQTRLKDYQLNVEKLEKSNKKIKLHLLDTKPLTVFDTFRLTFSYIFMIFWALIILFPVTTLIISSFNVLNPRYVTTAPFKFGFENYEYLINNPRSSYGKWYLNTVVISISTMIISTIFVAFTGYAYSRFKFRGSRSSLALVMLIQMIPATASLISLYVIVKLGQNSLGLDPRIMLVLVYSGAAIAGNTFVLKGYLDGISQELDDAAKIDGCGNWKLFIRIILPITKPMLAIIALWSFLTPFNDVILPKFVIVNLDKTTLPVGLDTFLTTDAKHIQAGAYSAGALIASLPPVMLFMYLQKFIVGGLSAGAVK